MQATLPEIKLDSFEGPFDLLLELARKKKLNLSDISLRDITDDFIEYVESNEISPSIQGDFVVVAATLLLLKARHLLPKLDPEEEEEIEDLTGRVRIYDIYRRQSEKLRERWGARPLFPAHFWGKPNAYKQRTSWQFPEYSREQLAAAMETSIQKLPAPYSPKAHLLVQGRTLRECLRVFKERLQKVASLVFQQATSGASKHDTAMSFLAVLEMAKKREVDLHQEEMFANLVVRKRP